MKKDLDGILETGNQDLLIAYLRESPLAIEILARSPGGSVYTLHARTDRGSGTEQRQVMDFFGQKTPRRRIGFVSYPHSVGDRRYYFLVQDRLTDDIAYRKETLAAILGDAAEMCLELQVQGIPISLRMDFNEYAHLSENPSPESAFERYQIGKDPEVWYEPGRKVVSTFENQQIFTVQEYTLVEALISNQGVPVQHDELLKTVYDDREQTGKDYANLRKLVSRVRQKIEHVGGDPELIATQRDVGYVIRVYS